MLGNDIVDLQLAKTQSNWRRKGYLEKIFTPEEQKAILNASNPNAMVWIFWSMKEAVYKIVNRQTLERFYSPQKFECEIISLKKTIATGLVAYNGIIYFTKSDLSQNFIYTLASAKTSKFEKFNTKYFNNSANYNQLLKEDFGINIQKNLFGVPEIIDFELGTKKPVSISHHGRYLTIAY